MEKTLELGQDINDENSSTEELSSGGGLAADRTRKLGEFSWTNSPLSVEEIKKRRTRGWADIRKTCRTCVHYAATNVTPNQLPARAWDPDPGEGRA